MKPSLITRLRDLLARKQSSDIGTAPSSLNSVFQSYSPGGNHPAAWADDPFEQVRHYRHWVYAAIRAIASRVAGTPLNFIRNDTGQILPASHPLPVLMRQINPFDTSVSLWTKTLTFLELTGNAYWYVPRNRFGAIAEIWSLPSQHMRVCPDRERYISGYIFRHGGFEESFSTSEIIHLKYPSPESVFYGKGPLQAAASSVDAHESMKESERRSFENGVFPGLAIQTGEKLSSDVRRRLEETLRRGFSGPQRSGRALILEQGLAVRPFTFSPREMDFLKSSKMTRDEILAIFGVPAAVAGISEDVNRASAEAMLYTFAENTILPKLKLLQAQLTQDLCSCFDARIEARFDSPLPRQNSEDRADMIARIRNGITTVNEERERLGLSALSNTEAPPPGNKSLGLLQASGDFPEAQSQNLKNVISAVLAGQRRRIMGVVEKKEVGLMKAVDEVLTDPEEARRLLAPLVPAISKQLDQTLNAETRKSLAREIASEFSARILPQVRSALQNEIGSQPAIETKCSYKELHKKIQRTYSKRILPAVFADALRFEEMSLSHIQ